MNMEHSNEINVPNENIEENGVRPWTKSEQSIMKFRTERETMYGKYTRNFNEALLVKLKESIFGCFLDIFNRQQQSDVEFNNLKMNMTEFDMKNFSQKDHDRFQRNNDFIDNSFEYLKNIIMEEKPVSLNYLKSDLKCLRLDSFYITHIDKTLSKFEVLQILSLHSNNIRVIDGSILPRNLKYLELYDNFITSVQELCNDPPKYILHLGLGRNCLNNESCLHLLAENFQNLRSIDISDNEISSLDNLAQDIRNLESLKSLQIEGNPCYVYQTYPTTILASFPGLLYLDGRELSPSDTRTIGHFSIIPGGPQLLFYCYRILALKEPPKDQKNSQTIHVEVDLPLLEPHDETEQKPSQTPKKKLDFLQIETTQPNITDGSKPSPKKVSPYKRPNEVFNKFCFKTEQRTWSKSIEFPVLEISAPENDPKKLRDTFRTIATVRIVYLKTAHPKRPSKKNRNPNSYTEKVTKRVTLCSFKCSLESLSWSDETLDFYWAEHPDVGNNAVKVDGCLRDMDYEGIPKPKYTPIAGRTSIPARSSASERKSDSIRPRVPVKRSHVPYPKILTCHVGFGLKRT